MKSRLPLGLLSTVGLLLVGCKLGPDYTRPEAQLPASFTGSQASAPGVGFGDLPWFELFHDDVLIGLIQTALKENADIKIAANRVLQAEAQAGISKSFLFPTVGASGGIERGVSATSRTVAGEKAQPSDSANAGLGASYEVDFWGKLSRQNEAAHATLLASMENQNIVIQSLVTGVAQSYFQLRELDEELEISHKTLDSRIESLKLVKMRQEFGASSMSDVRQAESLVQSARHAIPLLEQAIAQQENAINIVLGRYQGPVPRGLRLDDQRLSVTVPPGLPSTLLDRRPDVRMAEQKLVAANAQIGVAKAAYFPSISLTGSKGYASSELQQLMTPGASIWNVGTTLTAPVFQGGRIQQNVKLTELQKDELVLEYTKTLQQAFVDVSNSLVSIEKTAQAREEQQVFTATLEEQKALAKMRYEGGVAAYLEVLDSERECFDAQRGLAQAKRDELLSIISLYKSLGGGWKEAAEGKNGATP